MQICGLSPCFLAGMQLTDRLFSLSLLEVSGVGLMHNNRRGVYDGTNRQTSQIGSQVDHLSYHHHVPRFSDDLLIHGAVKVALGFMIVSNIYTTVGYFLHERAWSRIHWGFDDGGG